MIYHGWTLTSKLLFKDVLSNAIKPYAFMASDCPLILSIENHCSKDQQDKMAEYFVKILGDLLWKEPVDESLTALPSPEFFKNKILIKAKKVKLTATGSIDTHDDISNFDGNHSRKSSQKSTQNKRYSDEVDITKTSILTKSRALSNLVNYTEAVKFTNFEEQRHFWEMSSFEETKVAQFLENESTERQLMEYNCKNLSRIYPKGTRFLSSNLGKHSAFGFISIIIITFMSRSITSLVSWMSNGSIELSRGKHFRFTYRLQNIV